MIVDASALLAIVLDEPEAEQMEITIVKSHEDCWISPLNYLEAAVRIDRFRSPEKSGKFDQLVELLKLRIAEIAPEQAELAREAYRRFGKGNHPARLNLGDCFAYALSKARNEPLLFKGDDFRRTDVEAVL